MPRKNFGMHHIQPTLTGSEHACRIFLPSLRSPWKSSHLVRQALCRQRRIIMTIQLSQVCYQAYSDWIGQHHRERPKRELHCQVQVSKIMCALLSRCRHDMEMRHMSNAIVRDQRAVALKIGNFEVSFPLQACEKRHHDQEPSQMARRSRDTAR